MQCIVCICMLPAMLTNMAAPGDHTYMFAMLLCIRAELELTIAVQQKLLRRMLAQSDILTGHLLHGLILYFFYC